MPEKGEQYMQSLSMTLAKTLYGERDPATQSDEIVTDLTHFVAVVLLQSQNLNTRNAAIILNEYVTPLVEQRLAGAEAHFRAHGKPNVKKG